MRDYNDVAEADTFQILFLATTIEFTARRNNKNYVHSSIPITASQNRPILLLAHEIFK